MQPLAPAAGPYVFGVRSLIVVEKLLLRKNDLAVMLSPCKNETMFDV